jgi:hypothetical protein
MAQRRNTITGEAVLNRFASFAVYADDEDRFFEPFTWYRNGERGTLHARRICCLKSTRFAQVDTVDKTPSEAAQRPVCMDCLDEGIIRNVFTDGDAFTELQRVDSMADRVAGIISAGDASVISIHRALQDTNVYLEVLDDRAERYEAGSLSAYTEKVRARHLQHRRILSDRWKTYGSSFLVEELATDVIARERLESDSITIGGTSYVLCDDDELDRFGLVDEEPLLDTMLATWCSIAEEIHDRAARWALLEDRFKDVPAPRLRSRNGTRLSPDERADRNVKLRDERLSEFAEIVDRWEQVRKELVDNGGTALVVIGDSAYIPNRQGITDTIIDTYGIANIGETDYVLLRVPAAIERWLQLALRYPVEEMTTFVDTGHDKGVLATAATLWDPEGDSPFESFEAALEAAARL